MKHAATIGFLVAGLTRGLAFAQAPAAEERPPKTILSPAQCVQVLKLDSETCVDVMVRGLVHLSG